MKSTLIVITFLFSIAAFGQDTLKKPISSFKKLLIGINISPDYCDRVLKNNDGSSTSSSIIGLRNESEKPKLGYTAGLNICYKLSKHFGIDAGIQYSNKGYVFVNNSVTYADMSDPRFGFVYQTNTDLATKVKLFYNQIYLDVPLRVNFSFGKRRINFITGIGVTTNIFLKATQTSILIYADGSKKRKTQNQQYEYKKLNISPTLSLGVDYKMSNKINLRLEPTIRYGVLKIIDTPITEYLWNAGLNISCYYTLK